MEDFVHVFISQIKNFHFKPKIEERDYFLKLLGGQHASAQFWLERIYNICINRFIRYLKISGKEGSSTFSFDLSQFVSFFVIPHQQQPQPNWHGTGGSKDSKMLGRNDKRLEKQRNVGKTVEFQ